MLDKAAKLCISATYYEYAVELITMVAEYHQSQRDFVNLQLRYKEISDLYGEIARVVRNGLHLNKQLILFCFLRVYVRLSNQQDCLDPTTRLHLLATDSQKIFVTGIISTRCHELQDWQK